MKFNKCLEIKRIFLPSEWWLDEKDLGEVSGFFSLKIIRLYYLYYIHFEIIIELW